MFRASVARAALPDLQQPGFDRTWPDQQYFLFVQDTFKASSRLTLNYGVRYEAFGAPKNTGSVKDLLVELGAGGTLAQQIVGASLGKPASGGQPLFGADKKDWAVRAGASYDLFGRGKTVLRGGYGIFYDRPYDNLWQNLRNDSLVLPVFTITASSTDYLAPIPVALKSFAGRTVNSTFPDLTLVDPNLKNGYAHTYFAGIEHALTTQLTADVNAQGSYGRRLITTDIVNRDFSTLAGRINPRLPNIAYRSGQGVSNYNALAAVLRYRSRRGAAQATYTWSHAIDNQSDALVGDFFNLAFTSIQTGAGSSGRAAFSRQFDPSADHGNSDFDQRHNLVLLGYWELPTAALKGWTVSALAAFRSGFPYTVLGPTDVLAGQGLILNNRADLVDPSKAVLTQPVAVAGGQRLLASSGFAASPPSALGNAGRNAFRGPGFYNLDAAVSRWFTVRWLGESGRAGIRADAYNFLNHANLDNPDPAVTSPTFGVALYGRQGRASGFPAVSPLNESPPAGATKRAAGILVVLPWCFS